MGLRTNIRKYLYRIKFEKNVADLHLTNNTILVTGGNSGIGLALTKKLLDLKNNVIATYKKDSSNLKSINSDRLVILKYDSRDINDSNDFEEKIKDINLDIIINCAGVFGPPSQNIEELDFEKFKEVLMVNSLSILKIIQIILKQGKELKFVINISSDTGSISQNKEGKFYIYKTSKSTLNSITKNMSVDLFRRSKTIVFAIDPGNVQSGMNPGGIVKAEKCAELIIDIISKNGLSLNGKFINLLKQEIPW